MLPAPVRALLRYTMKSVALADPGISYDALLRSRPEVSGLATFQDAMPATSQGLWRNDQRLLQL